MASCTAILIIDAHLWTQASCTDRRKTMWNKNVVNSENFNRILKSIKQNQRKAAGFPRAPAQLAGARGKIYLEIIFFFMPGLFSIEFFTSWIPKIDFAHFSIFCILARGVKKIVASLLAYRSWFLFDQIIGLGCLENDTRGFLIMIVISMPNLRKTPQNHISASNRKFHPKGAKRQGQKESASHHYSKFILK